MFEEPLLFCNLLLYKQALWTSIEIFFYPGIT